MEKTKETAKVIEKTYVAKGLMEWHLHLKTGNEERPYVDVSLEGGQISGYGVTPASLTTSDELVQAAIENSRYFDKKDNNGAIRLVKPQ